MTIHHLPLADFLPHVCIALSSLLIIYLIASRYLWKGQPSAEAKYAFSASTIVRHRPPTVLQFSARVPLGSSTAPIVLRTFDPTGPVGLLRVKEEDRPGPSQVMPRSILMRSESVASVRNDNASASPSRGSITSSPADAARRTRMASSRPVSSDEAGATSESDEGNDAQASHPMPTTSIRHRIPSPSRNLAKQRVTRSTSRQFASREESIRASSATQLPATGSRLKLIRHKNPIRGNGKHDASVGRQYTWWFKTESDQEIAEPPALLPSCGLQRGDLFWHRTPAGSQFWLRVLEEATGEDIWRAIDLGYERVDGRILTITPKKQALSWVGGDWGSRRVSKEPS
ncbi:hypothetical protein OH77DRAFT_1424711 [Trametes cingulata]|nr:hypothetical protein OH77DRAFT_1424711 [Trametes cingulata]